MLAEDLDSNNCTSISDDQQQCSLEMKNESTEDEFILGGETDHMISPSVISSIAYNEESRCSMWAEMGLCNTDTEYMLRHCIPACLNSTILQTHGLLSYGSYNKYRTLLKPSLGVSHISDGIECVDTFDPAIDRSDERGCEAWAEQGECYLNTKFMLKRCAKSCLLCIPSG